MVSRQLYDNLPVYARYLDQRFGKEELRHLVGSIQPHFDEISRQIHRFEYIFDPYLCPAEHLDWLGQVVGLAPSGDHWLGLGLNPDWPTAAKRRLIAEAWEYWQIKGTTQAVRKAISLWLLWEPATDPARLDIRLPLGKEPTAYPPNVYGYGTPWGTHLLETFAEKHKFAWGDYTRAHRQPWKQLKMDQGYWQWGLPWSDRTAQLSALPIYPRDRSYLGHNNPWRHFWLETEAEWRKLLPDILALETEMTSSQSTPVDFIWLKVPVNEQPLEPVDFYREVTTVEKRWVDGHYWGQPWSRRMVAAEHETTRTESREESFQVWPGAQWGQRWSEELWLTSYQTITLETIVTETVPAETCTPGITVDLVTGQEERTIATPAVPANQLIEWATEIIPAIPATAHTEGVWPGLQWGQLWPSATPPRPLRIYDVPVIDVTGIEPIDVGADGVPSMEAIWRLVRAPEPRIIDRRDAWYSAAIPGDEAVPEQESSRWQLANPINIARYSVPWGSGYLYYGNGQPGYEETFFAAIVEEHSICGVQAAWTRKKIIWVIEEEVEIDASDYSLAELYPELTSIMQGNSWTLAVRTRDSVVLLKAQTLFWTNKELTTRTGEYGTEASDLCLEFIFRSPQATQLESITLLLEGQRVIKSWHLSQAVMPHECVFGFQFFVPFPTLEVAAA